MGYRSITPQEHSLIERASRRLCTCAKESPHIVVTSKTLSIGACEKRSFYQLMGQVTLLIAESVIGSQKQNLKELTFQYGRVRMDILNDASLERVVLPSSLESFLDSPVQALADKLQTVVFDYLQERIGFDEFIDRACMKARDDLIAFSRCGYEYWVFLSILKALQPRALYGIEYDGSNRPFAIESTLLEPGKQFPLAGKRIPDSAIETEEGKFYALKFECCSEIGFYDVPMMRRRDNTFGGDSRGIVGQRILMVYEIESLSRIPLIADRDLQTLENPLFTVEVGSSEEFDVPAYRLALGNRALTLKPKRGHFVVVPLGFDKGVWTEEESSMVKDLPDIQMIPLQYDIGPVLAGLSI